MLIQGQKWFLCSYVYFTAGQGIRGRLMEEKTEICTLKYVRQKFCF